MKAFGYAVRVKWENLVVGLVAILTAGVILSFPPAVSHTLNSYGLGTPMVTGPWWFDFYLLALGHATIGFFVTVLLGSILHAVFEVEAADGGRSE